MDGVVDECRAVAKALEDAAKYDRLRRDIAIKVGRATVVYPVGRGDIGIEGQPQD